MENHYFYKILLNNFPPALVILVLVHLCTSSSVIQHTRSSGSITPLLLVPIYPNNSVVARGMMGWRRQAHSLRLSIDVASTVSSH